MEKLDWLCHVKFENGLNKRILVSAYSMWQAEIKVKKVIESEHTKDELKRMGEYIISCRVLEKD